MAEKDWTNLVKKYGGQWVALANDETTVIANGASVRAVADASAKKGELRPILFKVPNKILPYTATL